MRGATPPRDAGRQWLRESRGLRPSDLIVTKTPAARATSTLDYLLPAIGMANVIAVATAALFVVPQFMTMYEGFGGNVPNITRLMLATYRGWALFALAVPLVWLAWPDPRTRGVVGLILGGMLAALLIAFGLWACYAPLFALAAVVG
jgi:hypothetical protein